METQTFDSQHRRRPAWRALLAALAVLVLAGLLPAVASTAAAQGGGSSAGSLAVALSGGSGAIDERTGLLGFQVPVGTVAGIGAAETQLQVSYSQHDTSNSDGLGVGWSWGFPRVEPQSRLVMGDGRAFDLDPTTVSGLADHRPDDVRFEAFESPAPAGSDGCPAERACASVLRTVDGAADHFDVDGRLVARTDRFGNTVRFGHDAAGRLVSVDGGFEDGRSGAEISYQGSTDVAVRFAQRADGVVPEARLVLSEGRLREVVDPAGARTEIWWSSVAAGGTSRWLPGGWVTTSGARVDVTYRTYEPGIVAVDRLTTTDAATGEDLVAPVTVSLDPPDNGGRNYTGYPVHHLGTAPVGSGTSDALVASNDKSFRYSTTVSDGRQTVRRTFDHLHRKVDEVASLQVAGADRVTTRSELTYPGDDPEGTGPQWPDVPAMFQAPERIAVTIVDPMDPDRTRTTESLLQRDDAGRIVRQVLDGTETTFRYDSDQLDDAGPGTATVAGYGLALEVVERVLDGDDAGHVRRIVNELSVDRRTVATTTMSATDPATGQERVVEVARVEHSPRGEVQTTEVTGTGTDGATTSTIVRRSVQVADGFRTVTATDGAGVATSVVVDTASGLVAAEVDADGATTRVDHDAAGRVVRTVAPTGAAVSTTYTDAGTDSSGINAVTEVREVDGYSTQSISDALGRTVRAQDNQRGGTVAPGQWRHLTATTYDERGQVVEQIDRAQQVTATAYDPAGRVSEVTAPDGSVAAFTYDEVAGTTVAEVRAPGRSAPVRRTTTTNDDLGRTVARQVTFGDGTPGTRTTWRYTGTGQTAGTAEESTGVEVEHSYAATGALVGQTVTVHGTLAAAMTLSTDGRNQQTHKTVEVQGSGSASAHLTGYDESGRTESETDAAGNVVRLERDAAGRTEATVHPDGRTSHVAVDGAGRVARTWWTLPDGTTAEARSFRYDDATGQVAEAWFDHDRAGTAVSYRYAPDATLLEVAYPEGTTLSYAYDEAGRRTSSTDPNGTTTTYELDGLGRVVSATQPGAKVEYRYDDRGRVAETMRRDGGGDVVGRAAFQVDDAGNLRRETHLGADGELLEDHTYRWSVGGLLESTESTLGDGVPVPDGASRHTSTSHTYDLQDRLVSTTVQDRSSAEAKVLERSDYALDAAGNVTSVRRTDGDGVASTTAHTYDAAGRLVAVFVDGARSDRVHDAAGNLVLDQHGNRFTYSADGKVTAWTTPEGATTELRWRPDGSRQDRTDPDGTVTTTWSTPGGSEQVVAESVDGADGSVRTSSLIADGREAVVVDQDGSTEPQWLVHTRRGDVTTVTDAAGAPTSHSSYTDHGEVTHTGATTPLVPYGYAGAYTDGGEHGTGHMWLGARQYDPGATVFTTKDPTSLLNRYAYGAGNPVTNVDPSGFSASGIGWQTWLSIGLAAVGVATAPIGGGVVFGVVSLVGAVGGLLLALEESEITSYIPDEAEEPLAWAAVAVAAVGGIGAIATKAGAISRLRWHMSTPGIPRDVVDDTWKIVWDDAALRAKYSSPARFRTAYRSNTKEGGEIHHLAIRGGQGEKQHLSRTEVPVTREGPIDIRPGFKDVEYDPSDLYHRTIERSMRQTAELGADQTRIGLAASNGAPTDEAMESLVGVRDGMSFWQDIGTSASRRMNLRDNPGYWKQTILNEGGAQVANDHMYYPRNGFWGYMKANRADA